MCRQQFTPSILRLVELDTCVFHRLQLFVRGIPEMSCSACTCHKCCGFAAELDKLAAKVAQVDELQNRLQRLWDAGKTLADKVASLQIHCGLRGGEDTIQYPQAQPIIILDDSGAPAP